MCPLSVNSRNRVACLDECRQEDEENEGKSVSNKSVQSKLTTISNAMQSLEDVATFIENKGFTSEATQVCHIRDLAAALKLI